MLRILFGALAALAVARYFVHGWIAAQFEVPTFFFAYPGLDWLRPLPAPGMRWLYAGLLVLALCIAIGWRWRPSMALFTAGFTYAHLCDRTNYLNHYWLVTLLGTSMCFLPMGRVAALDARRSDAVPWVHPWALWLLRVQVACVYVFAGVAKLDPDWLLRGEPLHTWLSAQEAVPLVGPWLARVDVAIAASWLAMLFDLTIPFLLLARATRPVAIVLAAGFHLVTALLLPIGLFPAFMAAFATVLLPPGWPRRLGGLARRGRAGRASVPGDVPPVGWPASVALGAWMALQVALPLRHLFLDGDPVWAEEGFAFSWRVMLFDKSGHARFLLRDPSTDRRWEVDPRDELTPVQARQMSTQPALLRAYAEHLAAREHAVGRSGVEVRVYARVAINGHPGRLLVDPTVDLAHLRADEPVGMWVTSRPGSGWPWSRPGSRP